MDSRLRVGEAFDLDCWIDHQLGRVEQALDRWVNASTLASIGHGAPAALIDAMRYAVLDGGKRLRPLLVLAACEAVRSESEPVDKRHQQEKFDRDEGVLRAACAAELIHAYSLVHDDMPCMDNDVLRRGKPTVHIKFGDAVALLAGDALQALAFELLTPVRGMTCRQQASLCRMLALAAGSSGMAGGQAIDLASVGCKLNENQLREMHHLKTGALLQASVMMGAVFGKHSTKTMDALCRYGAAVGLAFQVVDDILDVTGDSVTLGKTAGKDASQEKPTYVSVLGLARSRAYAKDLLAQALAALTQSGLPRAQALAGLANMVVNRSS